ncbi:MAG: hypothetical protein OET18_17000, partial [Desulfobacterales bacterium]|nr:hypothetical protein [Desulfobacterales bacterium]
KGGLLHASRVELLEDKRTMLSLRMPPDLIAELNKWRESQDVPPQRTAVIIQALKEFLTKRKSGRKQ